MRFTAATLVLSLLAVSKLVVAVPPACLLAAVAYVPQAPQNPDLRTSQSNPNLKQQNGTEPSRPQHPLRLRLGQSPATNREAMWRCYPRGPQGLFQHLLRSRQDSLYVSSPLPTRHGESKPNSTRIKPSSPPLLPPNQRARPSLRTRPSSTHPPSSTLPALAPRLRKSGTYKQSSSTISTPILLPFQAITTQQTNNPPHPAPQQQSHPSRPPPQPQHPALTPAPVGQVQAPLRRQAPPPQPQQAVQHSTRKGTPWVLSPRPSSQWQAWPSPCKPTYRHQWGSERTGVFQVSTR
jgi:hypothetical protein